MGTIPRTAIVTGASSGLGRELSRALARRGTEVALVARRAAELQSLREEIEAVGGRARAYVLDVADPRETVSTLQRIDDELGGVELVVANAGVGSGVGWSGKLTWESCAKLLSVNVDGAVATLTALLPRMIERRSGHLVGISSLAQYRPIAGSALYSASKAFLSTFLEGLRIDLRGTGVFVTDVRPGFVRTPLTAGRARMPFLLEPQQAIATMVAGIDARRAVVAFPLLPAMGMRASRLVPRALYDRLVAARRR